MRFFAASTLISKGIYTITHVSLPWKVAASTPISKGIYTLIPVFTWDNELHLLQFLRASTPNFSPLFFFSSCIYSNF